MRDRSHEEVMVERFSKDPIYALELMRDILMDGDEGELSVVLRQFAKAVTTMSDKAISPSLENLLHYLHHFAADADIRRKDAGYSAYQRARLLELIKSSLSPRDGRQAKLQHSP